MNICTLPILTISGIMSPFFSAKTLDTLGRNIPFKAFAKVYVYPSNVIAIPKMAIAVEPDRAPKILGAKLKIQR